MKFHIVVVWSWKDRKLVSFEQIPNSEDGLDRMEALQKKYYSKTSENRVKSELELWAEDVSQSDDPNYDVSVVSMDAASLEAAKKDFIALRSGD